MSAQLALFDAEHCQRWHHGRHSWRRVSEGGFDPRRHLVVPIDEAAAKQFVTTHHYSRAYPAARLRYGLIENDRLVGVAVLGVPMRKDVLTGPFPTLEPYRQSLELSRLVLLDRVAANAESWFVSRVFAQAADAGLRGVLAFSDPMPRHRAGELLMPGHVGTVYQALNAVYTGRGTARTLTILPDGTVLSDRSASKARNGERGAGHVIARLEALGAEPFDPHYWTGAEWLTAALSWTGATKARHRGNHRFLWAIGDRAQRRRTPIALESLPYPKTADLTLAA